MRRIKKLFIVSGLLFGVLFAQEPVTYTIEGKKDPRLEARFRVLYVSTGTSKECTSTKLSTGTRKPMIGARVFEVKDGNYSVKIPIAMQEDEEHCGYKFKRVELMMRRKYDKNLYSLHMILNDEPFAYAIYRGDKGGMGSIYGEQGRTPGKIQTDKKHFRIAKDTTYKCWTHWFPKDANYEAHANFQCLMQIGDGDGENAFKYLDPIWGGIASNDALGINELKSETLHVDILVDDNRCIAIVQGDDRDHFRTLPKPEPTVWEKVKSLF